MFGISKQGFFFLIGAMLPAYMQAETGQQSALKALGVFVGEMDAFVEQRSAEQKRQNDLQMDQALAEEKSVVEQQLQQERSLQDQNIKAYLSALELNPSHQEQLELLNNLAIAHFKRARTMSLGDGVEEYHQAIQYADRSYRMQSGGELSDQARYIKAKSLSILNQRDHAERIWEELAASEGRNVYVFYANLYIGDQSFDLGNAKKAADSYGHALKVIQSEDTIEAKIHLARAHYRLAWSFYKTTELEKSIDAAQNTLALLDQTRSEAQHIRLVEDSAKLLADNLFELGEVDRSLRILGESQHTRHGDLIAVYLMQRMNKTLLYRDAVRIGVLAQERFGKNPQFPLILQLSADAHSKMGDRKKQRQTLESLALLLPQGSLWRRYHQQDVEAIVQMEQLSEGAARFVAASYYDEATQNGDKQMHMSAASTYQLLLDNRANSPDRFQWMLRQANSYFIAEHYQKAQESYADLSVRSEATTDIQEISAYQLVMAHEREWRRLYSENLTKKVSSKEQAEREAALKRLDESVQSYANRFERNERVHELLLVAAASYRESGDVARASDYWQRVLAGAQEGMHRSTAMRGMLYASLQNKRLDRAIELSKAYLSAEDWRRLDRSLLTEVNGILGSSLRNESDRLKSVGKVADAGRILVQASQAYPDIPQRDTLMRDGAFYLAIAGDWHSARQSAQWYLNAGLKRHTPDMRYLLARSLEQQMRFNAAAEEFYALANDYPKYSRRTTCLEKAESLSAADDRYLLAGESALLLAQNTQSHSHKIKVYKRAVQHFEKAENYQRATAAAQSYQKQAKSISERMESRLYYARNLYLSGSESKSLALLKELDGQIFKQRTQLGASYTRLSAETKYLLSEEVQSQFEDYRLADRSGAPISKVNTKARYFEQLAQIYEQIASLNDSRRSAEARFLLASTAEDFSAEIDALALRDSAKLEESQKQKLQTTSDQLQRLAKKYHSDNVSVSSQFAMTPVEKAWVQRSAQRLTSSGTMNQRLEASLPVDSVVNFDIPQSWSF